MTCPGTHLDLLGTGGFLSLSDGSGGEKLGLDAWLELCGGCIGHLLLLLLRWLSCLNRHLLSSDLKETPPFISVLTFLTTATRGRGLPSAERLPGLAVPVLPSAGQRLQQRLPAAAASLSEVAAEPASGGRTESGPAHLEKSQHLSQYQFVLIKLIALNHPHRSEKELFASLQRTCFLGLTNGHADARNGDRQGGHSSRGDHSWNGDHRGLGEGHLGRLSRLGLNLALGGHPSLFQETQK